MLDWTAVINAGFNLFDEFGEEIGGDHRRSFDVIKILLAFNNNTLVKEVRDIKRSMLFLLEVFLKLLDNCSHSNILDEETDFRVGDA